MVTSELEAVNLSRSCRRKQTGNEIGLTQRFLLAGAARSKVPG